jgi:hypothetical protein
MRHRRVSPKGYLIGKGRPPVATRWKPGQSGNPKGRRRGRKNMATLFKEVLDSKIEITENGRTRRVTRLEAVVIRYVNEGLKGNHKAVAFLLDIEPSLPKGAESIPEVTDNMSAEQVIALYRRMITQVVG